MEQNKKTLVLGASTNPQRYSYLAIKKLLQHGHDVVAIGNKVGEVGNVLINKDQLKFDDIHTVTLYLNPTNQKPYYDYIISLSPQRVIFNPGTENIEFENALKEKGIMTLEACTLVMLGMGQF